MLITEVPHLTPSKKNKKNPKQKPNTGHLQFYDKSLGKGHEMKNNSVRKIHWNSLKKILECIFNSAPQPPWLITLFELIRYFYYFVQVCLTTSLLTSALLNMHS